MNRRLVYKPSSYKRRGKKGERKRVRVSRLYVKHKPPPTTPGFALVISFPHDQLHTKILNENSSRNKQYLGHMLHVVLRSRMKFHSTWVYCSIFFIVFCCCEHFAVPICILNFIKICLSRKEYSVNGVLYYSCFQACLSEGKISYCAWIEDTLLRGNDLGKMSKKLKSIHGGRK